MTQTSAIFLRVLTIKTSVVTGAGSVFCALSGKLFSTTLRTVDGLGTFVKPACPSRAISAKRARSSSDIPTGFALALNRPGVTNNPTAATTTSADTIPRTGNKRLLGLGGGAGGGSSSTIVDALNIGTRHFALTHFTSRPAAVCATYPTVSHIGQTTFMDRCLVAFGINGMPTRSLSEATENDKSAASSIAAGPTLGGRVLRVMERG